MKLLKSLFVVGALVLSSNTTATATTSALLSKSDTPLCGCQECTNTVLDRMVAGYSCRDHIQRLMEEFALEEYDACLRIGGYDFPTECRECNPNACADDGKTVDDNKEPAYFCGCKTCTPQVWRTLTTDYTCGARISYLTDVVKMANLDACSLVGGREFPDKCSLCDPAKCSPTVVMSMEKTNADTVIDGHRCGCSQCNDNVWNADADSYTCGERIEWLLQRDVVRYPSVEEACYQVANVEFSQQCGGCDPTKCSGSREHRVNPSVSTTTATSTSSTNGREQQVSLAVFNNPTTTSGQAEGGFSEMTLNARTPLYCFPDFHNRTRFRNVFGKYTVEVKESDGLCGPSDNMFTTNTVSLVDTRKLKLQFKKVEGVWQGSEIRLRLPEEQMPFLYGRYSFSVKSVEVIDTKSGTVIDDILPPSLVLGLFTWDATENFELHENRMHEVDIEISRWNILDNEDLQFLVQPPGNPQMARFFSGGSADSYKQAPRTFEFDWRPAEIEWYGDQAESHIYSAQSALSAGTPDYTQCLPADVEVRMNLWNLLGTTQPTGMEDQHTVEVVIDNFAFTPNGLTAVPDGGVCTKHCQCGNSSQCIINKCQGSTARKLLGETSETIYLGDNETWSPLLRARATSWREERASFISELVLGASLILTAFVGILIQVYRPRWVFPRPELSRRLIYV